MPGGERGLVQKEMAAEAAISEGEQIILDSSVDRSTPLDSRLSTLNPEIAD